MGLGGAGGSTIGTLVATNKFVNGIEVIDDFDDEGVKIRQINSRTQLNGILEDLKLLKTA